MKIGIITFHRAHNCGAALQCVALITVLKRMGHDVKVLDCNNIGHGFFPSCLRLRVWLGWFHFMLVTKARAQRLWFRYMRFRAKFMPMTKRIGINERFPEEFDYIVLGSDQVLNPEWMGRYGNVFLMRDKCEDKKKIAYAASFGVSSLPEGSREYFSEALSHFVAIGVREDTGLGICRKELGLNVPSLVTLDPTLLLLAEDYTKFERPVRVEGEYVLVYWMGHTKEYVCELAHQVAKVYGLRVIVATIMAYNDNEEWISVSPDQFLYLVKRARFVVTASFHGTAFAIINHKPFLTVIPRGLNVAGRMISLLNLIKLSNQLVNEGELLDSELIRKRMSIDFEEADFHLQKLRTQSLQFLQKTLM